MRYTPGMPPSPMATVCRTPARGQPVFLEHRAQRLQHRFIALFELHVEGLGEQAPLLEQADDALEEIDGGEAQTRLQLLQAGLDDIGEPRAHLHLVFRRVVEDPEADLATGATVVEHIR